MNCLIVVDPQNDFIDGSLGTKGAKEIVELINLELLEQEWDLVIFSADSHVVPGSHWSSEPDMITSFPKHCEAGSFGAAFPSYLNTNLADYIVYKGKHMPAFSAFEGLTKTSTTLLQVLRDEQVQEISVCGLLLDFCVRDTAMDSRRYGYQTSVLQDYTIASSTNRFIETLDSLAMAGVKII